jgi:putative transposase
VSDGLLDDDPWYTGLGMTEQERQEEYRQWIDSQVNQSEWVQIRQATQRGRLIGKETFQKQVEEMIGRRLVGEARGRPRKRTVTAIEKVL